MFVAIPETEYCYRDACKGEGENKSQKENAAFISYVVCSYSALICLYPVQEVSGFIQGLVNCGKMLFWVIWGTRLDREL